MQSENMPARHTSTWRAVRYHWAVVLALVVVGGTLGWLYAASMPVSYTSTARVLVNPAIGNPYAPTPASVRQDELVSLETEAQVARSVEVLDEVAARSSGITAAEIGRRLQVTVPPNTQILEFLYTANDPEVARDVADAVATSYLDNRARRFEAVNDARIQRVESRTESVISDLRAATAEAQVGSPAHRLFQSELATTLRNELVTLRAQRSALENTEATPGTVFAPATTPSGGGNITMLAFPVGGALAGLAAGCMIAVLRERSSGRTRTEADVEDAGLQVIASIPSTRRRYRLFGTRDVEAVNNTVRRLRATILDIEPRPDVITVTPAGRGASESDVTEALAESFAKAGHRVVLVRTDGTGGPTGLAAEKHGLAQALLHERLSVLDMLQPSVEPLLCLLPHGGFDAQSRELFASDRLRAVLNPLVDAGHLVILQAPGIDSAEGEAAVGAADLGLVVVTTGLTRLRDVRQVVGHVRTRGVALRALVVPHGAARDLKANHASGVQIDVAETASDATSDPVPNSKDAAPKNGQAHAKAVHNGKSVQERRGKDAPKQGSQ
jgi:capsular polysaccharide biosynthesis protein/Mrp family chromosome partitioning ATPase